MNLRSNLGKGQKQVEADRAGDERTALEKFQATARSLGFDPNNAWVGGHVAYELQRLPAVLAAYRIDVRGKRVLEFGCNVGATSVVLACLGAEVDGVDICSRVLAMSRANAELHGVDVRFHHIDENRLIFEAATFDVVVCNSVLEYVAGGELRRVMCEIDRVLVPGGHILVTGTSNRLWPREVHSGRWFGHWLPESLDRLIWRRPRERGVTPRAILSALATPYTVIDIRDDGRAWLEARASMYGCAVPPVRYRAIAVVARFLGVAPGWLVPNISMLLEKRQRTTDR